MQILARSGHTTDEVQHDDWIVVGVDGTPGSTAAADFAAHEARRLGTGVRLIHVVPTYIAFAASYPRPELLAPERQLATGTAVLEQAAHVAARNVSRDRIATEQLSGETAETLLGRVLQAPFVVVGDNRTPVLQSLGLSPAVTKICSAAGVLVVSVPSSWHPRHAHHVVAVGVSTYEPVPETLLREAFTSANDRGASLEVVHVRALGVGSENLTNTQFDVPGWREQVTTSLERAVEHLADEFPDVEVRIRVATGNPDEVLQQVARDVDLLLVARHPDSTTFATPGTTARVLLHSAACPVAVFPEPREA